MDSRTANMVVDALQGLARANWHDFVSSAALCESYAKRLHSKGFRYTPDRVTCGMTDCWSTYKDLESRYPYPAPILADCEDLACSFSAWLASRCYDGVYVGLVPGKRVAHAISGVERARGKIEILDPSRWYGMGETHYNGVLWRKLE